MRMTEADLRPLMLNQMCYVEFANSAYALRAYKQLHEYPDHKRCIHRGHFVELGTNSLHQMQSLFRRLKMHGLKVKKVWKWTPPKECWD